uniref:Syndecan n=1 Tax=Cuerna arida TaxID=1464854 RepID=A0A1B6F6B2_9HEMI
MHFKVTLLCFFFIGTSFSIKEDLSLTDSHGLSSHFDTTEGSGFDKDMEGSGSGYGPVGFDDEDFIPETKPKTAHTMHKNTESDDEDDDLESSGDLNIKNNIDNDNDHKKIVVVKSTEMPITHGANVPVVITDKPSSTKEFDSGTEQTVKRPDDNNANSKNNFSPYPNNNNNNDNNVLTNHNNNNNNNNNQLAKNNVFVVNTMDERTAFFAQPGMLAAIIGGTVVGLLCAILVVMFIVYRMRKKDEGSYSLNNEPKRSPALNYAKGVNREFFA